MLRKFCVKKCCVSKAERTFQVVNLFHNYDLPVGSSADIGCVFLLNLLMSFTTSVVK